MSSPRSEVVFGFGGGGDHEKLVELLKERVGFEQLLPAQASLLDSGRHLQASLQLLQRESVGLMFSLRGKYGWFLKV